MTEPPKCECELRDRKWNGYGRCLFCGCRYVEPRDAVRGVASAFVEDPTTAAIVDITAEREGLRTEVDRLSRALSDAYTTVEQITAECDLLRGEINRLKRKLSETS